MADARDGDRDEDEDSDEEEERELMQLLDALQAQLDLVEVCGADVSTESSASSLSKLR